MPNTTLNSATVAISPQVMLCLPQAPAILHILASRGGWDTVARKLDKLVADSPFALRFAGPGKWLALAPVSEATRLTFELNTALIGSATVLDQSDGRVLIRVSGREAREALAKGTAVDLDPGVFLIGHSAITAFGHVTVHLTYAAADAYELIVSRSYAESLWETLFQAAREFGCDGPAALPDRCSPSAPVSSFEVVN